MLPLLPSTSPPATLFLFDLEYWDPSTNEAISNTNRPSASPGSGSHAATASEGIIHSPGISPFTRFAGGGAGALEVTATSSGPYSSSIDRATALSAFGPAASLPGSLLTNTSSSATVSGAAVNIAEVPVNASSGGFSTMPSGNTSGICSGSFCSFTSESGVSNDQIQANQVIQSETTTVASLLTGPTAGAAVAA
ncbi:unnamed protein product, partial [Protopolystoma xenopodis]